MLRILNFTSMLMVIAMTAPAGTALAQGQTQGGQTATGQTGTAQAGTGQTGTGQTGTGQAGGGTGLTATGLQSVDLGGQLTPGLQTSRQGQFVGATADNAANIRSQAGGAGQGQFGQGQFGQGRGGFQNQNAVGGGGRGGQGGATSIRQVRAPLRLGFTPTPRPATQITATFQSRLPRMPQASSTRSFQVTMAGRTAVLRGTVESQPKRQLMENLARLEPGIWDVQNELVVAGQSSDSFDSPPLPPR